MHPGDTLYGCGREVKVVVRVDIQMCWVCDWGVFATWGVSEPKSSSDRRPLEGRAAAGLQQAH